MSNVNVGGVEGSLVLNIREWTQPAKDALSVVKDLGTGAGSALSSLATSTGSAASSMGRSFGKMSVDVNTSLQNIRQTCQDVGQAMAQFSAGLRDSVKGAVSEFARFQNEMRSVNVIAKLNETGLDKLQKSVRAMSGEMSLTQGPLALASALKDITGAGFDAADGLKVLRAAAKGADAGDTDTKTMAKGLAPTLKSYGLGADSSMVVMDQLFKGTDQGSASAEEMAAAMGALAPVAGSAGVSLQELVGTFALVTTKGQSASENATQMKSALTHLLAPAADAKQLLADYGIQAGETAIRTKGLTGVIKDLFQKTGGSKDAMKKILDDEGMQYAVKLMGKDQGKGADQAVQAQFGADGATEAAFQEKSKSLMFQLDQVKAAFQNFAIGVGAGLEPVLKPAAEMLNKIGTYLVKLPDGTKAALGGFMGLAAAVTTVAAGLTLLAPTAIQIGTWMAGFGGVAKVAAAATGLFSAGVGGIVSAVTAAAAPVLALVAVTALLYTGWQNDWGGIREFTSEVLADVQGYVKSAATFMTDNFGPALAEISAGFKDAWPVVKEFFTWLGKSILEVAVPAMKSYWETMKLVWAGASKAVKLAWGVIGPILKFIGQEVKDQIGIVALAISGDWKGAMDQWVKNFLGVGPRLLAALKEIAANVMTGMANLGEKVKQAFKDAFTFESPDESGWKATIDGPISRSVDFAKGKFGELSSAGQKAFFDVSRSYRQFPVMMSGLNAAAMAAHQSVGRKSPTSKDRIGDDDYTPGVEPPGDDDYTPGVEPPGKPPKAKKGPSQEQLMAARVVKEAESRTGVQFNPGQVAQCANFVRAVYSAAGVKVGVSSKPLDYKQTMGRGQGPGFANSFFGKDVGTLINSIKDLKAGDTVGFRNTYGNYAPGTITHAGVYVGDGKFTHRPTANAPVRTDSLSGGWGEKFAAGMRPFALGKGGAGMGQMGLGLEEVLKTWEKIQLILGKTNNAYETQRNEIRKTFDEATDGAKRIGAGQDVIRQLAVEQKKRIGEVNEAERRETQKTSQELVIMRLEAEGKMGEAANLRILGTAAQEKDRLQDLLKTYPALAEQINGAMTAIDQGANRQLASQSIQTTTGRVEDTMAVSSFQGSDPGMAGLIQMFPQFRADVEAAYAAIQAYIKDPSEATRARFQESKALIDSLGGAAQEQQQKRLEEIDFERQMGTITKDEAIQRQAEVLNNWVGGEGQKRQMMLGLIDTYRTNFETQLGMQGEFNIASLEQFTESLMELDSLTLSQQAQLAAANQMIQQQRITDQQGWQAILQQTGASFQTFLSSVMSGQQTFGEAFKALWKSISQMVIQEISKMIVKALILFALQKAIGMITGGTSEIFAGAGMMDLGIGLGHSGGMVQHGNIMPTFHSGGWVGGPLRSDETMAVLQTGEYVLSRQQLANAQSGGGYQGGGGTTVNAPITMTNYINSEMDIDRVSNQLGRKMAQVLQGAY